ncbi:translocation/assembly module TamB domain-containing protein [uncultured Tateyamaria sp.]|uniref:translocation/assembly module TamB domain-containing protein n=1 Tax=uncultured Tateyamaria sp. TaxID=455651 RepID=UPI00262BF076|nr:translocation/assembly module TamB domain-containing protein [uncultured Tateyamaria sp.]
MRFALLLMTCLLWPLALAAQDADEDDRGFIAGLLEGALGGDGRTVRIIGFAGALSSTATIDQITIADREGIWLTIDDVALTWSRRALLRGAIEVEELRAARIDLPRLPVAEPGIDVPDAEAKPFALPDLPASIRLGQLAIDSVALGAPVLGEAAELSLSGTATLANGAGDATLVAERIDGPRASFNVDAAYANETRALRLNLDLSEAADGLISGLMNLPGRPSVDLKVAGDGLLSDFAATLDLRTDGAPRLTGTLALQSEAEGPKVFDIDLNGDVTALFLPQYAEFFGPDVSLSAQGNQAASGALSLDQFALDTRALRLSGQAALNSDGWPTLLDIEGQISDPDGDPVLLPAGGGETRVDLADLTVSFDASDSDALVAAITLAGLDRAEVQARSVSLGIDGTLSGDVNAIGAFAARVDLNASGLGFADPALAQAIGAVVRGGLDVAYGDEAPLRLSNLSLTGGAWDITGNVVTQSLSEDFATTLDVTLDTPDLSAFAALAGLSLDGAGRIEAAGSAALGGFFNIEVVGITENLALGIPQADALLEGVTNVDLIARRDETGTYLDALTLNNAALSADVSAELKTGASTAKYAFRLDDAARVVDTLDGPLSVDGTARQTGEVWDVTAALAGPLDATANVDARLAGADIDIDLRAALPDLQPLVAQLSGGAVIEASARQRDGAWDFDTTIEGPLDSAATASGRFAQGALSANYTAFLPSLDPLVPGIPDALTLTGDVQQVPDGWEFATNLTGPYAARVTATGQFLSGILSADYTANLPDVSALAPGITGSAALEGNVQQVSEGWQFATDLSGPYSSTGRVTGTYTAARLATAFTLAVPNLAPLAPGVNGPLAVDGTLAQIDNGWAVDTDVQGPYASTATISGTFGEVGTTARYAVRLPNVGALVPRLSGAAAVTGTAKQVARGFDINASLDGPAGTIAQVQGLVATDGRLELDATGQAQLGLLNPFIAPRTIAGLANFDLTIDGPAALSSLRGRISTQGTRLAAPKLPLSLSDLSGAVELTGGQATLDLTGQVTEGGTIALNGPITLGGGFPAQLQIGLSNVVLTDNVVYTSVVNGGVSLNGALTGGARIAGNIEVGETTVQVPSSTVSTLGSIPDITHIGATRPVMRTRARAGLIKETSASSGGGLAYPLDITVNAPSRVFVRGRGIDAELGGTLRITGTTADTISTGQIDLIRGRLEILTKRFELDDGRIEIQGRFEVFLRLIAVTSTSSGTASIVVEGRASDPTVTFESSPEAPQDQVLAQIFFGRDISQLSAFQALQLASAVARLAGGGGESLISQLRGSFGLDDLDVTTDDEGNAAVRAGKYISENVYTDVTVGGTQGPEVSLNIDLTPNVTVRGSVAADSSTGVGIFIEKDY